jgi:hypothetical protein
LPRSPSNELVTEDGIRVAVVASAGPGVAASPAAAMAPVSPSPVIAQTTTRPTDASPPRGSSDRRSVAHLAGGPSLNLHSPASAARPRSLADRPAAASPSPLATVTTTSERAPGAVMSGIAAAAGSSPPPAAFRMLAAVVLGLMALLTPLLWLAPLPRPIPYLSLIERPG